MRRLRIGLIGAARIAPHGIIDPVGAEPRAELVAVAARDPERAQAFAAEARMRGWRFAVPHFRGCSGELNHAPRAYHSGDWEEVAWLLARFRASHRGALPQSKCREFPPVPALSCHACQAWPAQVGSRRNASCSAFGHRQTREH